MKRKWLAVGIILLFVGVTIAPTINFQVVKASTDDDLVEVTTQVCGIQGYENTIVKLSKEHYAELDYLFDTLKRDLENASSRQEAKCIIQDAVKELDRQGVLPVGMNVEQAQRYLIREAQFPLEKILNQRHDIFPKCVNVFCLFSLTATRDSGAYPLVGLYGPFLLFSIVLQQVFWNKGLYNQTEGFIFFLILLSYLNPLRVFNILQIQGFDTDVLSIGFKGLVDSKDVSIVLGFTGIMLYSLKNKIYFLGSALALCKL
jgi:hypothetical protein